MMKRHYYNLANITVLLLAINTLIAICIMNVFRLSDRGISFVFTAIYLYGLYSIWNTDNRKVSLFFVFYLSFGLFIGGRFFTLLLGFDGDLFMTKFSINYPVPYSRRIEIIQYVLFFILFSIIGYNIGKHSNHVRTNRILQWSGNTQMIREVLFILFPIIVILIACKFYRLVVMVLNNGYLSLYVDVQNEAHSGPEKILNVVFYILFALAITCGDKPLKKKYTLLFLFMALTTIFMGGRGMFGAFLLTMLYLYAQNHSVSLGKVAFYGGISLILLLSVFTFSVRNASSESEAGSTIEEIINFSFKQGGSLMSFDASRLIDDYPTIPYFSSFLPGIPFLYSLMTGKELYDEDVSFAAFMTSELTPQLYYSGYGMGWSILSDLYLFSGRTWIGFTFLSVIFGVLLGRLEKKSTYLIFYKYISILISPSLFLLPRAGINNIFPVIVYATIVWIFLYCARTIKH